MKWETTCSILAIGKKYALRPIDRVIVGSGPLDSPLIVQHMDVKKHRVKWFRKYIDRIDACFQLGLKNQVLLD
jgi:hypothetical protein